MSPKDLTRLAQEHGLDPNLVRARLRSRMTLTEALTLPKQKPGERRYPPHRRRMVTIKGVTKPLMEWAREFGCPKPRVDERWRRGGFRDERLFAPVKSLKPKREPDPKPKPAQINGRTYCPRTGRAIAR